MAEIAIAFDADNHLGETPIWSQADEALWWVNCEEPPQVHRWHPASGAHARWAMPQRVGGLVHKAGSGLLIVLADGIYDFAPETGELALRAPSPEPALYKLHECHCDRQGRLWVGAYDNAFGEGRTSKRGAFFRLEGAALVPMIEGIAVANALAFSPDGKTLYAANSPERRVRAWDYDIATGTIAGERTFLQLAEGEGFVDGATVDSEGGYWLANVAAGRLRRYLPDGTLERMIELPFTNPTKPGFGGPGLATLYVTSTRLAMPAFKQATMPNGPVYQLATGFHGVAEVPFAG